MFEDKVARVIVAIFNFEDEFRSMAMKPNRALMFLGYCMNPNYIQTLLFETYKSLYEFSILQLFYFLKPKSSGITL